MRVTQERLKEALGYDPTTGVFICLESRGNKKRGATAGSLKPDGYIRINIDNNPYQAHCLAWLYEYGYIPENDIDHIDRNPSNNRIENLRETTMVCNCRNTKIPKNNKTGIKGVCRVGNGWVASIGIKKRTQHIIKCSDFDEAVCYRLAIEQCLDWSRCDIESPAYKYVRENIQRPNPIKCNPLRDML